MKDSKKPWTLIWLGLKRKGTLLTSSFGCVTEVCADLAASDEDSDVLSVMWQDVAWLCAPELSQALYLSTLISAAVNGGWYYPALGTVSHSGTFICTLHSSASVGSLYYPTLNTNVVLSYFPCRNGDMIQLTKVRWLGRCAKCKNLVKTKRLDSKFSVAY